VHDASVSRTRAELFLLETARVREGRRVEVRSARRAGKPERGGRREAARGGEDAPPAVVLAWDLRVGHSSSWPSRRQAALLWPASSLA
jgi:hypothetical protein